MLGLIIWDYLFIIEYLYNYNDINMAESDNYIRLVDRIQLDERAKRTMKELDSFYSYAESMGISSKKKVLLKTREEMKFEYVRSNWM